jgi:ParB/RepB/Spo0J family partition protein
MTTVLNISAEMVNTVVGYVPLALIDPNPWQSRLGDDPAHVQKLADDIKARAGADPADPQQGLLQVPIARQHPTEAGRYQIAFGHTRLSAFRHLSNSETDGERWERFPLHVRTLTDRDMAELAARENAARKDLTAIETARAIKRLIADFHLSQIEAGKLFGYSSQSAVSNLLRLLELPDQVQDLVHSGEMPERNARLLIPVARVMPELAVKVASTSKEAEPDQFESILRSSIRSRDRSVPMYGVPWGKGWKPKEIPEAVIQEMADKGIGQVMPACESCEWHLTVGGDGVCARPICLKLKTHLFALAECVRVGKKLGIAPLAPGEKIEVIYDGDYDSHAVRLARRALASRHESLRLFPLDQTHHYNILADDLGKSDVVGLATVDMPALKKALPKESEMPPATDYEARRRAEERERKEKAEVVLRMLRRAASVMFGVIPAEPTLVNLMFKPLDTHYPGTTSTRCREMYEAADLNGKRELVMFILLSEEQSISWQPDPDKTRQHIIKAAEGLRVKLPAGWDRPDEPAPAKSKRGKK